MIENHDVVLVTEDKWQRVEGGVLDEDDRKQRKEASQNGRAKVVVMNLEQAFTEMRAQEPEKFQEFKKMHEKTFGRPLTFEELIQLSIRAKDKKTMYDCGCRVWMTVDQAREVRHWRVDLHYTWRAIARAAHKSLEGKHGWPMWNKWQPSSNQIMGMALCERAAAMLGENYRQEPWN